MDGSMESAVAIKEDSPISVRIGRVRWSICAMLFAATTINYMDRQVIGILKPTLQASIGMSELDYGYVVDAFQFAYALGLLMAGRFVDRIGTRIGYMVIMALWSLSAMGHALANTVLQFGIARACLGIGESGNFPAAIKTTAEWFPQSERSLCGNHSAVVLMAAGKLPDSPMPRQARAMPNCNTVLASAWPMAERLHKAMMTRSEEHTS